MVLACCFRFFRCGGLIVLIVCFSRIFFFLTCASPPFVVVTVSSYASDCAKRSLFFFPTSPTRPAGVPLDQYSDIVISVALDDTAETNAHPGVSSVMACTLRFWFSRFLRRRFAQAERLPTPPHLLARFPADCAEGYKGRASSTVP